MEKRGDPFGMAEVLAEVSAAWLQDNDALRECWKTLGKSLEATHAEVVQHLRSFPEKGERKKESAFVQWVNQMAWSSQQYHRVWSDWIRAYVDQAPELPEVSRHRARFWVNQIQTMLEPANYFWTNPKAVQRFVHSKGESLNKGLRNWMEDARDRKGLVSLADQDSFTVGEDLAATPGWVIFRNEIMELIQYAPQTETVRQVPIVLVQPWINKYYIFDLSARNSLVSYLVQQGYTVFITSWKNPGPGLRHLTYEDYMFRGALQSVQIARQVCHTPGVHLAGYCIGGTLITTLMGWLAHDQAASPVTDATLFSALVDFSSPGDLGTLLQPEAIEAVKHQVAKSGVLENHKIAAVFRMLNPKDLLWRYAVNNYFFGEAPPRSDMLFWNSDGTNLPEAMCNFFLTAFYKENRITDPGTLDIAGRAIDLRKVRTPFYVVGAAKDHICPWQSTFQTCRLIRGKVRYVLSDEGHITGIVTPPSPWSKKRYWVGAATRRRDAGKWLKKQSPSMGSWWPDWVQWLEQRSGSNIEPPTIGTPSHPPLCPAPGTYVHE